MDGQPGAPMGALWAGDVPAAALAVVRKIEAFSATPYDDAGPAGGGTWTIGFGSTRDDMGFPVTAQTPPITLAEAEGMLRRDMEEAAQAVGRRVRVHLLACEAAGLISWTYNLGEGALVASHMLVVLNEGEKERVPAEMGRWIMAGGKPSLGLRRRRWAEAGIFVGLDQQVAVDRAWSEIHAIEDWPAFGVSAAV